MSAFSLDIEQRVLVLAPTAADANLTKSLLAEAGLPCLVCPDLASLCREFTEGAGAILLTEDAFADNNASGLVQTLRLQPPWSDIAAILLTSSGSDSAAAAWAMDRLGNVTVLERPVRVTTLISTLRTALRARRRQYELRGHVEILRHQSERLRLLCEAASILLTTQQPDAMMRDLFAKLAPHFRLDAYFNFVVEETGEALRLETCFGIPDDEARKISRLEFGEAVCGTVAQRRLPIIATHIQRSNDPKTRLIKGYGIRSYACNPLMAEDRLLGTLSFASRSRDWFEPEELDFFQTVCRYVSYAYERLRLIRRMREEDRRKDDFLATLAHELRNPLAPIRNAEQYLRLKGPADADFQHARDIIDRQVRQLTRLVDDLLDVSRITRGKVTLQLERVDIADVIERAVELSRPMIEAAGHRLTVLIPPAPLVVKGDVTRLAQVFGNLLTNAAKYTDKGGAICLAAQQQGSDIVVSVKDNGIGLSGDHLPCVFEMFSQVAPALERSQGGLGIGLWLVKSLVDMHGGRVDVRSDGLGRGAEFIVRIPSLVETPRAAASVCRPTVADRARVSRKVLIADDNVDSAQSLAMMLSVLGHDVRTAHDGDSAVEMAESFQPEIILLDIGMPKLNGYEVARHIRTQPWGRSMLLAALTGWGQEEDKRRAVAAGFDHHFTKPVDPVLLESLISSSEPACVG